MTPALPTLVAGFSFASPWFLVALLLIPLGIVAYLLVQLRRPKYAVRFTNLDLLANVVERTPNWRRHLPAALYMLAIAALVLALARPERDTRVPREEATVILVMDVSGSMLATDVQPTRLAAAQEAAITLIDKLPAKFRVSLVSFSTGVTVNVSPTDDHQAVKDAVLQLRSKGGTAMGDAMMAALDIARPQQPAALPGAAPTPTPAPSANHGDELPVVVVLLSDGANTAGNAQPLDAAAEARDLSVPFFTVAVGTQEGIAEVEDNAGRLRRVRVPPDEETLQQVADITGGNFFSAPSEKELKSVYAELGSRIGYDTEQREVTYWFAGLGAALVLVAGGLSLAWFNRFP
ncbi:MAG: VWA domain-containing protein [Dehalococcoidia bacterium]